MPLVRCPIHGRVYDSAKDGKCPLCLQEESMPRAPGKAARETTSDDGSAKGRLVLLLLVLFVVLIAGGVYWYIDSHNSEDRAQVVRDSLRAAAAGPPRPDTTRFARASDFSPIRHARALRASLESMLAANRGALMGWAAGPIDTTVTDRAGKRHLQQYNAFYKHWMDRLDAITRNGTDFRYAPGVQYSLQMDNVTNQLQAAASVMRDIVRPYEVKPRTERQADIRAATGYLHAAGTVLTNLPH